MSVFTLLGRNFAIAAGAHVVARLLNLVVLALVARRLGVESLAGFAIANAIGTCFLFASDLGLAPRLVRESAARPRDADDEYARALGVKLAMLPILAGAIAALYAWWPFAPETAALSVLFAVGGTAESFSMLNFAVCRSRERFAPEATGQTVQALIALVIVVAALRAGYGMVALGWAAIVATGVELILSTAFALRFVRFAVSFRGVAATLRAALPFATTNAGAVALAQLDVIVLSIVAVPLEVGHYAAASRLLLGGSYFVILASDVVVPSATLRWVTGNRERFRRRSTTALRLMMFAAVPVALVLVVSAPMLVRIVYGPAFAPVAVLLQLGSAFAALKLWTTPLQAMLTVTGRQRARAISVGCGLAVTGALILMLGARQGATGAVVALACGEAAALAAAYLTLRETREPISQLS